MMIKICNKVFDEGRLKVGTVKKRAQLKRLKGSVCVPYLEIGS
jgi:hypothetical protein